MNVHDIIDEYFTTTDVFRIMNTPTMQRVGYIKVFKLNKDGINIFNDKSPLWLYHVFIECGIDKDMELKPDLKAMIRDRIYNNKTYRDQLIESKLE